MEVRGKLGEGADDEKEMVILGRKMRWLLKGSELEAGKVSLKQKTVWAGRLDEGGHVKWGRGNIA